MRFRQPSITRASQSTDPVCLRNGPFYTRPFTVFFLKGFGLLTLPGGLQNLVMFAGGFGALVAVWITEP
jgi:hypothetical protein